MNRFTIIDIARLALANAFFGLGLALVPGRSRLTRAVDQINAGIDTIADEIRKDHP